MKRAVAGTLALILHASSSLCLGCSPKSSMPAEDEPPTTRPVDPMTADRFWDLIAQIDRVALQRQDDDKALAPLTGALARLDVSDIKAFEEQLARVLFALDGRVYADHAGRSGSSDDGFLYCRCYVVARGKEHYAHVRAHPTAMPQTLDEWCEGLLYVAGSAWARKTGRSGQDWGYSPSVSYETGRNAAQWK